LLSKSNPYAGGTTVAFLSHPYAADTSTCFLNQLPMLEVQTVAF